MPDVLPLGCSSGNFLVLMLSVNRAGSNVVHIQNRVNILVLFGKCFFIEIKTFKSNIDMYYKIIFRKKY